MAAADMAAAAAKAAAARSAAASSAASAPTAAAKSTAARSAAVADEDDGAGCAAAAEDVLQIDRRGRCRRRSLNGGQEKQAARQSGHSRRGYSHDKSS
jgi:hypothetical protein